MSTRRSRAPRSRKSRPSEVPSAEAVTAAAPATTDQAGLPSHRNDPTQTSQLRALEAGWDELLG